MEGECFKVRYKLPHIRLLVLCLIKTNMQHQKKTEAKILAHRFMKGCLHINEPCNPEVDEVSGLRVSGPRPDLGADYKIHY
jgi:hypothetical protein